MNELFNLEYVNCNLCGSGEYAVIYETARKTIPDVKFSLGIPRPNHGRIVRCERCNLVYVNPREDINRLRQKYSKLIDSGYCSQKDFRMKTFLRKMRLIEKYAAKGRILDIGCASGYFLYVAKRNGWQIEGVEISKKIAEEAEKLLEIKIKPETVEEAKFPSGYFDVACMFDVIEHLPDPSGTLKEASKIIKPGGILAINFPDIDTIFAKFMGRHWWFLLEDHLYYFNRKTLTEMLNKYGFEVLFFKPHWQDLTLIYLIRLLDRFNPDLSKALSNIATALRVGGVPLRYYAGQTTLLAKKI